MHAATAGVRESRRKAEASNPAMMMPLNHRSMMKVVPQAKRVCVSGENRMVPKVVIRSAAMCRPTPIAAVPMNARQPRCGRSSRAQTQAMKNAQTGSATSEWVRPR